jgi:heterodisulfide reductase subunit A-like polyferredoxin
MLFYFTATGNCLYVAKKLNPNPISIPQALRGDDLGYEAETIGIVCPIYAGDAPGIVIDFMRKAKFKTDYFYMVMTYGNDHTDAAECTERIGKEFGLRIDYINTIKMVDNYLPVFDMNEQMAIDKKVDKQISVIAEETATKTHKILESTEQGRQLHAMVASMFRGNPSINNGESIVIKENCVGCGICSKVCPIGNVYIENSTAKRRNTACDLFCLACVHCCPQNAVGLRMERNPNARYRHKEISLHEIIAANNQGK